MSLRKSLEGILPDANQQAIDNLVMLHVVAQVSSGQIDKTLVPSRDEVFKPIPEEQLRQALVNESRQRRVSQLNPFEL